MTKIQRKNVKPIPRENILNKHREVRDIFNKIRKKYQLQVVYKFFYQNYFLRHGVIDYIMCFVDKEPVNVDNASITYKAVMKDDFYL